VRQLESKPRLRLTVKLERPQLIRKTAGRGGDLVAGVPGALSLDEFATLT
jgi:hypothetical protein